MNDDLNNSEANLTPADAASIARLLDELAALERECVAGGLEERVFERSVEAIASNVPAEVRWVGASLDALAERDRAAPDDRFEQRMAAAALAAIPGREPVIARIHERGRDVRRAPWYRRPALIAAVLALCASLGGYAYIHNARAQAERQAKAMQLARQIDESLQELWSTFDSSADSTTASTSSWLDDAMSEYLDEQGDS